MSGPSVPCSSADGVTGIVINYHVEELACSAINSLLSEPTIDSVLVIDNGSESDLLMTRYKANPRVSIHSTGTNLGYAAAANWAVSMVKAKYVFILNPDATVLPGAVSHLTEAFKKAPGIVGPAIEAMASQTIDVGATMNRLGMSKSLTGSRPPLYVSGCALFTSTAIYNEIGGMDERYFLFVEDVELCWRALLAGYEVQAIPLARVRHIGGASIGGGYYQARRPYSTSAERIALRERNTLAMMVACAPLQWLGILVPVLVGRMLLMALWGIIIGSPHLARLTLKGLLWNVTELPFTIRRRTTLKLGRRRGAISKRFCHEPIMLRMFLQSGPPKLT